MACPKMASVYNVLGGVVLGWLAWTGSKASQVCRCQPDDTCWPSGEQWAALNTSIAGNLVQLKPAAQVCHEPTFEHEACQSLQNSAYDSAWRASQPGLLQDWVWETGSGANETTTCPLVTSTTTSAAGSQCHQGRIPVYAALVESATQVQEAVSFARQHRLRLVIRNTGHDGAGRSSGPDSFQIFTHRLKNITYHPDGFQPTGSAARMSGSAVTVAAGVMQGELYAQGTRDGFIVVGGECPTVGAAGGFVLGGGVSSILSHTRGLAVDNVLEFEVVIATGERLVANAYQNPELFWALRGGGGATFGVITGVTVRAFPNTPVFTEKISLRGSHRDVAFWQHGVAAQLEALQRLNREGIVGQFEVQRLLAEEDVVQVSLEVYHLNATHPSSNRMSLLRDALEHNGLRISFSSRSLSMLTSALRHGGDIYPEDYGIVMGSVVMSNAFLDSSAAPQRMAGHLSRFPLAPGDLLFTSNLGGRVNAAQGLVDTAMHPAWRSSSHLMSLVRQVRPLSVEGKVATLNYLTQVQMPMLYALDPSLSVSYFNLPDPNQKDAPQVYWGENYSRLLRIKQQWDPDELFIVRSGVGSKDWDNEGLCKQQRSVLARTWSVLCSSLWHAE